jgi:Cu/Ag efflux protein CusF
MKTLAVALVFGLLLGCRHEPSPAAAGAADQSYSVRGLIRTLPTSGAAAPTMTIHHESLPTFVREDGAVVGMKAMAMTFTVAPSVSTSGFVVGDRVEFAFEVRWKSEPRLLLTGLNHLAADTKLEFER